MGLSYEGDKTRALAVELGYIPVVPQKSNRKILGAKIRSYNKQCNQIERLFRRIKHFRCIFTRYDKLDVILLVFIYLALIDDTLIVNTV